MTPGVILTMAFDQPQGIESYNGYIDYIGRAEAAVVSYTGYQDYMDNPEKSQGLFSADKLSLSPEEKRWFKELFQTAQDNGSLLWRPIISFDNKWLAENGLYDAETNTVDRNRLAEYTQKAMSRMLKKEGLDSSAIWIAAVHNNTDNIHIHVAIAEPNPQRKSMIVDGQRQFRGKFKNSSLGAAKAAIVNSVLQQSKENQMINNIVRGRIIQGKKGRMLSSDPEFSRAFLSLLAELPPDRRLWHYNMNAMEPYRPMLNNLSSLYIQRYHKEDYLQLQALIQQQEAKYSRAYGQGKKVKNNFAKNKEADLYSRLGNQILKEMSNYQQEKEEAQKKTMRMLRRSRRKLEKVEQSLSQHLQVNRAVLISSMEKLRYALDDEYSSFKNLILYEQEQVQEETFFLPER